MAVGTNLVTIGQVSVQTLTRGRFLSLAVLAWICGTAGFALAQGDARSERIQFKKGASGSMVSGRIKGDQAVDYLPTRACRPM